MIVAHDQRIEIGHRQGESRPLQKPAHVAHVGERCDARARAADCLFFGDGPAVCNSLKVWPPSKR